MIGISAARDNARCLPCWPARQISCSTTAHFAFCIPAMRWMAHAPDLRPAPRPGERVCLGLNTILRSDATGSSQRASGQSSTMIRPMPASSSGSARPDAVEVAERHRPARVREVLRRSSRPGMPGYRDRGLTADPQSSRGIALSGIIRSAVSDAAFAGLCDQGDCSTLTRPVRRRRRPTWPHEAHPGPTTARSRLTACSLCVAISTCWRRRPSERFRCSPARRAGRTLPTRSQPSPAWRPSWTNCGLPGRPWGGTDSAALSRVPPSPRWAAGAADGGSLFLTKSRRSPGLWPAVWTEDRTYRGGTARTRPDICIVATNGDSGRNRAWWLRDDSTRLAGVEITMPLLLATEEIEPLVATTSCRPAARTHGVLSPWRPKRSPPSAVTGGRATFGS